MAISTGHILNKRYRVVKTITQGGFGRLYRAWDMSLKKPVALKQNLDDSQVGLQQFETEARILSNLHHPNLARVTDYFFTADEGQFLVMDFVEGEDLHTIIENNGPLPEEQAVVWISQVCDALTYIHSHNPPIIHRDIKPANIRITPDGRAVLVDFGIAKTYAPNKATMTGARAVTPGYAPVEQYGFGHTDARSDVYAIGATLYTLLTGVEPPESINLASGNATYKLDIMNMQVTPAIRVAIQKAMALQPGDRYQSIAEFQNALKVQSTQPTRHPWISKAVSIVFAILVFIDLIAIFSSILQFSLISRIISGANVPVEKLITFDQLHQGITFTQLIIWGLSSIIFLAWVYFTSKYLSAVSHGFKYDPVWSVVGCLIPFYNLIFPYMVLSEIWVSSDLLLRENNGNQRLSNSKVNIIWWSLSLISLITILITLILLGNNLTINQMLNISIMFIFSYSLNAIAAATTVFLVIKIEKMQQLAEKQHRLILKTIQLT